MSVFPKSVPPILLHLLRSLIWSVYHCNHHRGCPTIVELSLPLFREAVLSLCHHHIVLSFGSRFWCKKHVFLMKTKHQYHHLKCPRFPMPMHIKLFHKCHLTDFCNTLYMSPPTITATSYYNKEYLTQIYIQGRLILNMPTIMTWYYTMWNKKSTRCHLVLYLFLLYKLLNMFRATLCPSSGADDLVVFLPRVV